MSSDMVRRTETALVPMPKGFEVTEIAAPTSTALVRVDGDPYREPGPLAVRPGLSITWTEDSFYLRLALALASSAACAGSVACWILGPAAGGIISTLIAGTFAWFTRAAWSQARWVRADHEGLHWPRLTWTARRVPALLPASEIAQLFVRDETDRDEDAVAIPNFVLYARAHGGRDHPIVQVENPEQAWWLEARLEQHLGIVNRRIEGEHRREPPLLPEPPPTR
jgi:hypothetical protein